MKPLNTPHDLGYKWLLSSREIFLQLLRSFVKQPWIEKIDESTVTRTDTSFIAKDFREKEADIIYEAHLEGETVVFSRPSHKKTDKRGEIVVSSQ